MSFLNSKKFLILVFLLPMMYWTYLFFASNMQIAHDAIGYQGLGALLKQQGWVGFFKTGPHREPFYVLLISLSMHVADFLHISYAYPQKIIQIFFLFITQLLTLKLARKLQINNVITALIILYIGLSPALVNSAFSLFSEIASYPFVPAIILVSASAFKKVQLKFSTQIIILGLLLGVLFTLVTFIKAIFEYIFFIFLVPYLSLLFLGIIQKKYQQSINALILIAMAGLIFYPSLHFYKSLNKHFNGHFSLTDSRGPHMLYGATILRTEKNGFKKLPIVLSTIPGWGVCQSLYGREKCFEWFQTGDGIAAQKKNEVYSKNFTRNQVNDFLLDESKRQILSNPLQYALFIFLEYWKTFFWESTKVGYVIYPGWLDHLFNTVVFKNALRLFMAFLTFAAFTDFTFETIRKFSLLRRIDSQESEKITIHLFMFLMIVSLTLLYSLFYILTRYIFPIVPLYLIIIGYFFHKRSLPKVFKNAA